MSADTLDFHVTTAVNGRVTEFQAPLADPFVHHRVTTWWCWRDRLRILLGRPTVVEVTVGGLREAVDCMIQAAATDAVVDMARRRRLEPRAGLSNSELREFVEFGAEHGTHGR